MSISQVDVTQYQLVTPPSSFIIQPLTPPLTDKRPATAALRVIALFRQLFERGRDTEQGPLIEFQLAQGEYDEIESTLQQDEEFWGFVQNKIRYDYDGHRRRLTVRMPTTIHENLLSRVEDAIWSQLKTISNGSGRKAQFAQNVQRARSSEIKFPNSNKSKYEPDASFLHSNALYPGVIIEVGYSQKEKDLGRLAESYLLDSDASVRTVIGLNIEYNKKRSRKATLSIWRPRLFDTSDGSELRVEEEAADETFRDDKGNPVDHPGIRLRLSDFAYEELVQDEMGDEDIEIYISGIQLCQYLTAAESRVSQAHSLGKNSLSYGVKKRKRSRTPPEEIRPGDEVRYIE